MLFPSSRPHRIPPSTTDSQYDTTTGYSSSSYTKWPRSPAKLDVYATRKAGSNMNPSSRQNQLNRRRNNYLDESLTDISTDQYFRPKQQQQQQQQESIYSTISPQRPTVNYLLP
jgi:hypothetical protein